MGRAAAVVATLCGVFVVRQFYSTAIAVIAPDLMRDFDMSVEELGGLSGTFLFSFALMQIPVGLLLDRYGPRATISVMLIGAVAGALVFATATSVLALTIAFVLIGIGSSSLLMGALVVFARWFPPDRFATLTAIILAAGGAGQLLSATPLALGSEAFGWRTVFFIVAALTAGASLLVWRVVRDHPLDAGPQAGRRVSPRELALGYRRVLRTPGLTGILALSFVSFATLATIRGVWGGPYLHDVHGLDAVGRGNVLLAMSIALIVGTLCYGPLDRLFGTRKGIVLAGGLATIIILAVIALSAQPSLPFVAVLFALIGLVGNYDVVLLAHGRALFADDIVGRGITLINVATFAGAAVMQVVTGLVIGLAVGQGLERETAYRLMFGLLAAAVASGLIAYARMRDVKPAGHARGGGRPGARAGGAGAR